jgi:phosphate transport system substrate-binding protein
MNKFFKSMGVLFLFAALLVLAVACGGGESANNETQEGQENQEPTGNKSETTEKLSGEVMLDGSSTVYPIQEAIAEEYRAVQPDVQVTVGVSGTGGGFERFAVGETDMSNASRPIKDNEAAIAKENSIEFVEIPVAYDGLSVIVSNQNDFVKELTVEELNKIWTGQVTNWKDVRPDFPDHQINLYGPGTDSGTFDYWVEAIVELNEGDTITPNFVASEDDNVLVKGVSQDKYGLSYFGYAYYQENADKLNLVAIVNPDTGEAVLPSEETINDGSYAPLSRPIYTYINTKAFKEKPQVQDYAYYMVENAGDLALEVGYINLPENVYEENLAKLDALK